MPKGVMWRQEDLFFAGMGGGFPAGEPAKSPEEVGERAAAGAPGDRSRGAGAVRNRRDGRNVYYRLDDAHVRMLLDVSREHVSHKHESE